MPWQDDVATILLTGLDDLHASERRAQLLLAKAVYDSAAVSTGDEGEETAALANSAVLAAAAAGYQDAVDEIVALATDLDIGYSTTLESTANWEDAVAAQLLQTIDTLPTSDRRARLQLIQSVYESAAISESDGDRVTAAGTAATSAEDAADGYQAAVTNVATIFSTLGIT